jgi:hypothetical protein
LNSITTEQLGDAAAEQGEGQHDDDPDHHRAAERERQSARGSLELIKDSSLFHLWRHHKGGGVVDAAGCDCPFDHGSRRRLGRLSSHYVHHLPFRNRLPDTVATHE